MKPLLLGLALLVAAPAAADDLRDLCPDRPGLDTPPCIVDKGHVLVEAGLGAWQHDKTSDSVTNTFTTGDVLVRLGVTDRLEGFVGWTAYNHERIRDRQTGLVTRDHGSGDVIFGVKQSLLNPDGGDKAAVAVQVFATAPTGSDEFGAGGWTQGVLLPIQLPLPADFTLALTPEVDRVPDTLRPGHHALWTGVGGISHDIGKVTAGVELLVSRDDDPGARVTQVLSDLNLSYAVGKNLQLDAELDAGLNRQTPDVRIAFGVSRRF